ncbi:hypothetical protein KQX54_008032 [Cotesia glomerata]|uniref:Uncharacterized protein n=1 Tax=Cotesia glomerata TaxID=32391 RepID=A0AAV7J246_COTGL|nr:hypothetical protein KQX54_008032 [Cotesia glomerata]
MAHKTNKEGDGTVGYTTPQKECKVCSRTVVTEVVNCSKCPSIIPPVVCAKTTSVLSSGGFQRCCGPKKTLSYDDMRELMDSLRRDIRGDINKSAVTLQNTFTKTTEALSKRLTVVEKDTSDLKMTVVDLKNTVTVNQMAVKTLTEDVKSLASTPAAQEVNILMEVEDRLLRRKNVIIFDVEESNNSAQPVREAEDLEKVKNICSSLKVPAIDCKCFRIDNFIKQIVHHLEKSFSSHHTM